MGLVDYVRRLVGASGAAPEPILTPGHFTALAKLIGGLPVVDLIAVIEGRATLDSVIEIAEQAARIVGAAFPPAAITSGEVVFGLEALKFICDLAGVGGTPVTPGQNPIRGGFEGARGHV